MISSIRKEVRRTRDGLGMHRFLRSGPPHRALRHVLPWFRRKVDLSSCQRAPAIFRGTVEAPLPNSHEINREGLPGERVTSLVGKLHESSRTRPAPSRGWVAQADRRRSRQYRRHGNTSQESGSENSRYTSNATRRDVGSYPSQCVPRPGLRSHVAWSDTASAAAPARRVS
jgi:hypothetical protein